MGQGPALTRALTPTTDPSLNPDPDPTPLPDRRSALPGHGRAGSEAPPLPLTPEPFCEAVLRAACGASGASNALGAGGGSGASLVGVGHSIGGTALVLAELARPGTLPP